MMNLHQGYQSIRKYDSIYLIDFIKGQRIKIKKIVPMRKLDNEEYSH